MNTCYDCEGNKKLPLKQRKAIGGMLLCKKHFSVRSNGQKLNSGSGSNQNPRRRGISPLRRRTVDTKQHDRLKPKKEEKKED